LTQLSTRLGKVHQKVLKRLLKGDWVSTQELLELTNQKYVDRRIRELRDEEGWPIIHERRGIKHGYRLVSTKKVKGRKRHYLSSKDKRRILERDTCVCQICFRQLSFENAQIDHRIPLIRDGDLSDSNLQTLCPECNVLKRGYCHKCTRGSCEGCFLSDPSLMKNRIVIQLPSDLYDELSRKAIQSGKTLPDLVVELLYTKAE
jgi:5-methylcytosine-specific restriction endonuclease McrA